MSGPTILLVEDDESVRRSLARNLAGHGYRVVEASDVRTARAAWEAGRPDLVLLDLGLPDGDGAAVLRRIRREAATPVLVLTARDAEREKIVALDAGADDYVTKPFSIGELHARIRALLRRSVGPIADPSGVARLGPLRLDPARREVRVGEELVHLTPREFEVLRVLLAHAGRVVTHGRLLRAVWGEAYDEEAHYLHVYVSQLRRKLAAADRSGRLRSLIASEPGVGYRVRIPEEAPDEPPPDAGQAEPRRR
ncbi:MAG TPA: response regulator transcription factor [Candidatus Limnocylindrales bacterium]|nr:response regulator transcription factor [Candidatus Limnocylindrales bacterium]